MIFFLTGASGVGKTSLVNHLEGNDPKQQFAYFHFDRIGIPSAEEMGDPQVWQEKATYDWIAKLVELAPQKPLLFEGSTNMDFIQSTFEKLGYNAYQIVLIDCEEDTMTHRLIHERDQPELVNEDMKNWLKYLRKQAIKRGVPIINTSHQSLEESAHQLKTIIQKST